MSGEGEVFSNLVWLGVGHRIEEGEEAAAAASQKGRGERELNQRAMATLGRRRVRSGENVPSLLYWRDRRSLRGESSELNARSPKPVRGTAAPAVATNQPM